jgi:hypothetical protein
MEINPKTSQIVQVKKSKKLKPPPHLFSLAYQGKEGYYCV